MGLQSVGLMRASTSDEYEKKIKSCKCVKDIRTLAQGDPNFKGSFLDSVEPVKALLSSVFQRLRLRHDPFQVFMVASCPGIRKGGERERLVHTVCACT